MKKLTEWSILSIFPRHCAYCDRIITADRLMCSECERNLPRIFGDVCTHCGRMKKDCTCKKASNYYTSVVAPFYFEGLVRSGIHRFKFRKGISNCKAYAFEMSETIKERYKGIRFDYITEVPASEKSVRKRGYNQCSLLAKEISDLTGIEYKHNVLYKVYETDSQHGLNYYMRSGNLTGVFDCKNPEEITGKTILLCDDISTSGETLNECAKMLWLYNAKDIYCISAALTKSKVKQNVGN